MTDIVDRPPYTADKPPLSESSEELRRRIPGWGVDLDPADRPSVPRMAFDPDMTDLARGRPEQQPETWPRERSMEHAGLTPVFGTSCPPRGLSGALRKIAYARYSEGRAAHWLILLAADRVDAIESHVRSFATLHPDNPVTETGVLSEFSRHGLSSRLRRGRADLSHQVLDPLVVAGPWLLAGAVTYRTVRGLARLARR